MPRRCSHCGHNGHNSRTCLEMKESPENHPRISSKGSGQEDVVEEEGEEEEERKGIWNAEGGGGGGFKLFGVRFSPLDSGISVADSSPASMASSSTSSSSAAAATASSSSSSSSTQMRKCASMGNLSSHGWHERERGIYCSPAPPCPPDVDESAEGYASDDLVHSNSNSRERKKGVPWTEEEHRDFLLGLEKLGKGDWRGISRKFVKTRTPTQVASHAQKYFLRRNNLNKRRRRSSLFDITADTVSGFLREPLLEEPGEEVDACAELELGRSLSHGNSSSLEIPHLSWRRFSKPPLVHMPMLAESAEHGHQADEMGGVGEDCSVVHESQGVDDAMVLEGGELSDKPVPAFAVDWFPTLPAKDGMPLESTTKIVKPTPIIVQSSSDQHPGMDSVRPVMAPTPLSYRLLEDGSRHSAFHTTASANAAAIGEIDGQSGLPNAISVP